jgi:hypothetical protein
MKIGEKFKFDETTKQYIHQKVHDFTHAEKYAKAVSETTGGIAGESRLIGTIPRALVNEWLKEAGVTWDDVQARQQVVKRKILSGDFDKFRVWKGTY